MKLVLYGPYNKIIKRNSIQNIAFNRNLSLGEDLLFVFKCIQCCSKFVFKMIIYITILNEKGQQQLENLV